MPKVVNYTPEQTLEIVETYTAAGDGMTKDDFDARDAIVKELAKSMKKEVRSIRSKLVNEDVYIARSTVSKVTGETPEKKEVIAARLVAAIGSVTIGGKVKNLNADSLAKANKSDLAILLHVFNEQIVEDAEMDEDENDSQEEQGDTES